MLATAAAAVAAEKLRLYRACRRIEPVPALDVTFGMITVCASDRVRVIPRRGGWRHDPDEIRALAAGGIL